MKALEDITVQYNNVVTISSGEIIQFIYGDDGIDPMCTDTGDKIVYLPRLMNLIKSFYPKRRNDEVLTEEQIEKIVDDEISKTPIHPLSENFINDIKEVEIQTEWWDELEEELSFLQSEIAFRREEDVKACVMSFYINKIKKPTKSTPNTQQNLPSDPQPSSQQKAAPDDIKKAKNLVKEQTMPSMMWQKVILDLIESHPEVSPFIIDYLGS